MKNSKNVSTFGWYTDFSSDEFSKENVVIEKSKTLKILHANVGGDVFNKIRQDHDFHIRYIQGENPDILLLSETFISAGKTPPDLQGFQKYSKSGERIHDKVVVPVDF